MRPKSSIQKGRRFENFLCQEIERAGFGAARREVGSGSGLKKGDIFANIPFLIEAKNQKTLQWWQSIDQSKEQARIGNQNTDKWALVVRDPRTPETEPGVVAVIDFWQFLALLKKDSEPRIKEPDRELKFYMQRLVENARQIIKRLE